MKVSIIIPAYNEERLLPECLECVLAEVARTPESDAEVLVVNNASTDATREVALRFPGVRVVDEPKKGLVQARHAGTEASAGELLAHIDADTRVPPGWLSTVLREFQSPRVVGLSGPYVYYDLSWWERALVRLFYAVGFAFYWIVHYILRRGAMLQGGNYVVRRDALERIGGFDTTISFYGEDTDIAKRLAREGEVRWTWRLPMHTSGRRLRHEGVLRMGLRYALNFLSVNFFSKPATREYTDVRPE